MTLQPIGGREYDNGSINKHSIWKYQFGERVVYLDRTLDGCPPFFHAYYFGPNGGVARTIPVRNRDYWGDGWNWKRAEAALQATLNRLADALFRDYATTQMRPLDDLKAEVLKRDRDDRVTIREERES